MVENLCIIQARVSSSRLPAKMMLNLDGKTLLQRVYENIQQAKGIDKIVIATSKKESDDLIEIEAKKFGAEVFRGDLENVLKRYYECAFEHKPKYVIRICGDSPFINYDFIDIGINSITNSNYGYIGFKDTVYGIAPEIFTFQSLEKAYFNYRNDYDIEHVTPYIIDNEKKFLHDDFDNKYKIKEVRAVIDDLKDYIRIFNFYEYCNDNNINANLDSYLDFIYDRSIIF